MYEIHVFPCGICLGAMVLGDELTCPYWLILMMKTKDDKNAMWIIVCVWCVDNGEWFERLVESLLMLLWIVQYYENSHPLVIFVNMSLHCFETWLWQVLCALRNNEKLRGCTISRVVSRAAMSTIFWGTYRTLRWILYFEKSIALRDGYYYRGSYRMLRWMHGQICPPWVPDWETSWSMTLVISFESIVKLVYVKTRF